MAALELIYPEELLQTYHGKEIDTEGMSWTVQEEAIIEISWWKLFSGIVMMITNPIGIGGTIAYLLETADGNDGNLYRPLILFLPVTTIILLI